MSAAEEPVLLVEDRGAIRLLTLNRPDKLNALDNALTRALLEGLQAADAAPGVHAVLLTGAGRAFCAGADLAEFKELTPDRQERVDARARLTTELQGAIAGMGKPVVAAVRGHAVGGGAGLAIAADMVVAGEGATFAYPEIRHGIVAAIVMANLVRQVGRKAAFELVATGRRVTAAEALRLGMVTRVVADEAVLDEGLALAAELAGFSPVAMAATKRLFHEVADLTLAEGLERGRQTNAAMRAFPRSKP